MQNKRKIIRTATTIYQMGDRVEDIETGKQGFVSSPCGGVGGMVTVLWDHAGERHPARMDHIRLLVAESVNKMENDLPESGEFELEAAIPYIDDSYAPNKPTENGVDMNLTQYPFPIVQSEDGLEPVNPRLPDLPDYLPLDLLMPTLDDYTVWFHEATGKEDDVPAPNTDRKDLFPGIVYPMDFDFDSTQFQFPVNSPMNKPMSI